MEFFSIAVPIVTYDILENYELYNDFIKMLTRSSEVVEQDERRRLEEEVSETGKEILERISDQTK